MVSSGRGFLPELVFFSSCILNISGIVLVLVFSSRFRIAVFIMGSPLDVVDELLLCTGTLFFTGMVFPCTCSLADLLDLLVFGWQDSWWYAVLVLVGRMIRATWTWLCLFGVLSCALLLSPRCFALHIQPLYSLVHIERHDSA